MEKIIKLAYGSLEKTLLAKGTRVRALHKMESTLDRFREAHYWIHMLEEHYHQADTFRWYLNTFLKSIKEVPDLLTMGLQNERAFKEWFRDEREGLRAAPLIAHFAKQRNRVVHERMLLPNSSCVVGVTELRGMKLGMGFKTEPREDVSHIGDIRMMGDRSCLRFTWTNPALRVKI